MRARAGALVMMVSLGCGSAAGPAVGRRLTAMVDRGVERESASPESSLAAYRLACALEEERGCYHAGMLLLRRGDVAAGVPFLRYACEKDLFSGCFRLYEYYKGPGMDGLAAAFYFGRSRAVHASDVASGRSSH